MSDQTPPTPEQLQGQLNALLAQLQVQQPQAGAMGWAKPQVALNPAGLAVPLSIDTPNGKIRVYLQFPQESAQSPQAIMSLLESLANQGYPLDIWRGGAGAWGASSRNSGGWRR